MDCKQYAVVFLAILSLFSGVHSQSDDVSVGGRKLLRMRTEDEDDNDSYCESWKFTVENNDAGAWETVPIRCVEYVKRYITGERYLSDSEFVAADSLAFAKTVSIAADGKDCWVFDVDDTLLSNLPYYAVNGYGSEIFNETSYDEWIAMGVLPTLPASLGFYNKLLNLNFTIILLTGRSEKDRNIAVKNLHFAGYSKWHKLLLKGPSDKATNSLVYKSKKRVELEAEGYRIHGSSGDQWSDLLGNATAVRSFKLPNPMYYIA